MWYHHMFNVSCDSGLAQFSYFLFYPGVNKQIPHSARTDLANVNLCLSDKFRELLHVIGEIRINLD